MRKDQLARRGAALLLLFALTTPLAALAQKKGAAPKKKEPKALDYEKTNVRLKTSLGDVTMKLFFDKAPSTVKSVVDLAATGFYDGTLFHRVIPGFVLQGGDPLTKDANKKPYWGTGERVDKKGVPLRLKAEFNEVPHRRGIVSMARATDPDSASSQFFIVLKDSPFLDRQYTVFGEVVSGMDVVDKLVAESNPDTSDPRSGGTPRSYQKLLKVELVEAPSPPPGEAVKP